MIPNASLLAFAVLVALPSPTSADWSLTAAAAPVEWIGDGPALERLPRPLHVGERLRTGTGGRLRVLGPEGLVLTLGEVAELGFDSDQGMARLILDHGLMQIETATAVQLTVVHGGHARRLELGEHSQVWLEQGPGGTSTCLRQGVLRAAAEAGHPLETGECDYQSPQGRRLRLPLTAEAITIRRDQLALPGSP